LEDELESLYSEEREEVGLLTKMDVEELFTEIGRCMKDMRDGYCVGGFGGG
jgi:hypothetical protein